MADAVCALIIIAQCGMDFVVAAICSQHEPSAVAGVASTIITSIEATSLKRHIMLLKVYYGAMTAGM